MFNHVPFIDTPAGHITIGAIVRSTSADVQGIVTAIYSTAYDPSSSHSIQVNGRYVDRATSYELVAPVAPEIQDLLDQGTKPVVSGAYEIRFPHEGDRIYFADTARHVVKLIQLKIGMVEAFVEDEIERLERAAAAGRCDELRFRGSHGIVGLLAYVSSGKKRPAPKFEVGQLVLFFDVPGVVQEIYLISNSYHWHTDGWSWYYFRSKDQQRTYGFPERVVSLPK